MAMASIGRTTSIASHAREYLPGFRPSCRNPKHGSYPLAAITRASLAAVIDTAKLCNACKGVSANRAVNCRGSSPDLPCRLPIYLLLNDRHCAGGLNPFAKHSSKFLHCRHHCCADLASTCRTAATVVQASKPLSAMRRDAKDAVDDRLVDRVRIKFVPKVHSI